MLALQSNKVYSAREALQFIPHIASEPSMRKFIEEDLKGRNILKTLVQKKDKQRRFFIRGENIAKLVGTN